MLFLKSQKNLTLFFLPFPLVKQFSKRDRKYLIQSRAGGKGEPGGK